MRLCIIFLTRCLDGRSFFFCSWQEAEWVKRWEKLLGSGLWRKKMRSRPLGEKRQELLQMREREVGEWAGRSGLPAGWELVKILIG